MIGYIVITEPVRGAFSYIKKGESGLNQDRSLNPFLQVFVTYYKMLSVSCIRWNLIGIFFRFWSTASFLIFGLVYINLFNKITLHAYLSLVVTIVGGIFSNLFWARLSQ